MHLRALPSQEYLRECFDYDPDTGVLTWRFRPRAHFRDDRVWRLINTRWAGRTAGAPFFGGLQVRLNNVCYLAHRLIWRWMTGIEPPLEIDHRDFNRLNNRWNNLRLADDTQNGANRRVQASSRLGIKGVYTLAKGRSYYARIKVRGIRIHLGSYPTAEEAHEAYCCAARKHFGEFWHP